jgi:hypothetical protein
MKLAAFDTARNQETKRQAEVGVAKTQLKRAETRFKKSEGTVGQLEAARAKFSTLADQTKDRRQAAASALGALVSMVLLSLCLVV